MDVFLKTLKLMRMRQDKKKCKICGRSLSSYKSVRKLLCLEHDSDYLKWKARHGLVYIEGANV